jgi:hypothetical protein
MTATAATPFATLEAAFGVLATEPTVIAVDGTPFAPALPARQIPLAELRPRLLHPSVPPAVRDAVVAEIARRAQEDGGWLVGLAGLLLPGLRRALAPFVRGCPHRRPDLEAEALTGLVEALRTWDGDPRRLAARLVGRSRDHARRLFRVEFAAQARHTAEAAAAAPPRPWGHPDLVLARAVADGVIGHADAELIGETRIGGRTLRDYAAAIGESEDRAQKRRKAAERRLVTWLCE